MVLLLAVISNRTGKYSLTEDGSGNRWGFYTERLRVWKEIQVLEYNAFAGTNAIRSGPYNEAIQILKDMK